jgi:hypothetical protein
MMKYKLLIAVANGIWMATTGWYKRARSIRGFRYVQFEFDLDEDTNTYLLKVTIPVRWHRPDNWQRLVVVAKSAGIEVLRVYNTGLAEVTLPSKLTLLAVADRIWMATSVRGPANTLYFCPPLRQVVRELDEVGFGNPFVSM